MSAVIYTLISFVYYLFIPFQVLIKNSETIGAEFFELTLGSIAGTYIVPIFVGSSMFISVCCNIFVFSRSLEASAKENLFPFKNILASRNRFLMPYNSSLVISVIAIAFTIIMPSANGLSFMIDAASFPHWIATALVIGTLIYIRLWHPEIISPYTSWLICLILFFLGAVFVVGFPMLKNTNSDGYDSRSPILVMFAAIFIGFTIYFTIRKTILKDAFKRDMTEEEKRVVRSSSRLV
eukprot:NODE_398_length_8105_cov_1.375094.p4 type:complete len:237 gc:universal NODE_398_length_8105_cov_1.375094:2423-1713(-)